MLVVDALQDGDFSPAGDTKENVASLIFSSTVNGRTRASEGIVLVFIRVVTQNLPNYPMLSP